MRTLAATVLALGALGLSACCTTSTVARPVYAAPRPMYHYYGPHPVPYALGGGWCWIEGEHVHEYGVSEPRYYAYENNTYVYSGPQECAFGGEHPMPGGGWCSIDYAHTHNYCPPPEYRTAFIWNPTTHVYVYSSPGADYHGASPIYGQPGYAQPAYGQPGYAQPAYGQPGYHSAVPVNGGPGVQSTNPSYQSPGGASSTPVHGAGYVPPNGSNPAGPSYTPPGNSNPAGPSYTPPGNSSSTPPGSANAGHPSYTPPPGTGASSVPVHGQGGAGYPVPNPGLAPSDPRPLGGVGTAQPPVGSGPVTPSYNGPAIHPGNLPSVAPNNAQPAPSSGPVYNGPAFHPVTPVSVNPVGPGDNGHGFRPPNSTTGLPDNAQQRPGFIPDHGGDPVSSGGRSNGGPASMGNHPVPPASSSGPTFHLPPQAPPNNYAPPHTVNAPPTPTTNGGMLHMDRPMPARFSAPPAQQVQQQQQQPAQSAAKKKAPPVPVH